MWPIQLSNSDQEVKLDFTQIKMRARLLQRGVLQSKAAIEDVRMANEAAIEAELPLERFQEPQQP